MQLPHAPQGSPIPTWLPKVLKKAPKKLGHIIKVETQGSIGVENRLTEQEIAEAELVVIAADVKVDLSRFTGKKVYETASNAAIKDGAGVITAAINS